MMKLECPIVVTTTPDLERYHLKRSKVRKNIEYIYIDHACATLNMTYRTGAFDYYDKIPIVPFNITSRNKIGRSIEKSEVNDIYQICQELLNSKEQYADEIEALKNSYFYNLGTSGEAGADYILERLL